MTIRAEFRAEFRTIPGTQGAEGIVDGHAVIVDRSAGVAGFPATVNP